MLKCAVYVFSLPLVVIKMYFFIPFKPPLLIHGMVMNAHECEKIFYVCIFDKNADGTLKNKYRNSYLGSIYWYIL